MLLSMLLIMLLSMIRATPLLMQNNAILLQLLASLVTTTTGRTAGAELHNERDQAKSRGHPHKRKHLFSDMRLDVQTGVGIREDIGEDDEHDCCDHRSHYSEEGCQEGQK